MKGRRRGGRGGGGGGERGIVNLSISDQLQGWVLVNTKRVRAEVSCNDTKAITNKPLTREEQW